jgi:hypothetical protein
LQSFEIDDSNGNNNGKADAGENILLNVTLYNFGNTASSDLNATLSTADTNVTITGNANTWSPLDPGASGTKNSAFSFDVGESFVNGHIADFGLEITDGTDTWNSDFSITLHSLITELTELQSTEPIANINIYPNPFINYFTVEYELAKSSDISITVFDLLGNQYSTAKPDFRQSAGRHNIVVDAANFPRGVYLCKIQAGDYTVVKRIVH